MKMRQLQNYMSIDGEIPDGTYIVEGELKLVRFFFREDSLFQEIYRTYHCGETITIKDKGRYYIIFYEKIDLTKNIKLIENYLHRNSKGRNLQFLSCHYYVLKKFILKEHTERFYLDWIFKFRKEPNRIEVFKGEQHILNLNTEYSEYKKSPKDYKIVIYK